MPAPPVTRTRLTERLGRQTAAVGTALFARLARTSMLEVLRQDYVRTARAKGLRERIVVYRHAFRNAMIPLVTVFGLSIGLLVTGAFFIETIFNMQIFFCARKNFFARNFIF